MEKVHTCSPHGWNLASRLPYLIWGFQHVAGFRRRHVGASIQDAWTTSLDDVRATLDADTASDRALLLRAMNQELEKHGTRCWRRCCGDSNCRRSRPPRRTRWRKSTRRTLVLYGATCKG
jgi:hypothetical protein